MLSILTKTTLAVAAFLLVTSSVLYGQTKLPIDPATSKISYKFSIDFDKSYKAEAVYALAKDWFAQNPGAFTRSNTSDSGKISIQDVKNNVNREAVLQEFANLRPLQFTDPESNRLSGKVIAKYTGGSNGCIRLFYLQYSIILVAEGNHLTGEISNIRYNHFNARTYQMQPVFNWGGNMPCDNVNTLEYLRDCETCHAEFEKFYSFLDSDMNKFIGELREFIKTNKGLAFNAGEN